MNNLDVAGLFYELADLLELLGVESFKIRAYRKAAEAVATLPEEIAAVAAQGRLQSVPGVGKAIAAKIQEALTTGSMAKLEEARGAVPPGVRDLTRVPGLGVRTAMLLYTRLGIDSLDSLELAAREGRLTDLPGMGLRKEAAILESLCRLRVQGDRLSIGAVLPLAEALAKHLRAHPLTVQAEVAGSIRRRRDTVADIDLVVATSSPQAVLDYVAHLPLTGELLEQTPERLAMATSLGRRVEVVAVPPERFARAWLLMTGSAAHLRELGLSGADGGAEAGGPVGAAGAAGGGDLPEGAAEAEIYARLGLSYIEPELREGLGEAEAARTGRLPRLLRLADLRGDLHSHTTASDGTAAPEEMAEAARALGHRYLAICDHSRTLAVARGLTPQRLADHAAAIRRLNRRWTDFRLLAGTEVDILKDGSLDYPDEVLAGLDVVVASIHSHMQLDAEAQTQRLLRAIANPHVDIIGHPTGRILGRREPYALDFDRVLSACAATGKALEISASPSRLDLSDLHARLARSRGVKLAINSDAHSVHELKLLEYGVGQARRAWLESGDVINALELPDLLAWLARPKG